MKNYSRNEFKLCFDKNATKFIVNEKKGVVVCIIYSRIKCPYSSVSPVYIYEKEFKCIGVAKCSKEDTFNVNRGKRVALTKAENQAYIEAKTYLIEQLEHLSFNSLAISNFIEKSNKHCKHNNCYIEMITNPQHSQYREKISDINSGETKIIN